MRKIEWKFALLSVISLCLMVSTSVIGSMDSVYVSTPENTQSLNLEKELMLTSLEDMPLRMTADLVYDSESDRAIFFGGSTENLEADYDDTWSYDYNTNTWTNMSPAISPPASEWCSMAYHSVQDKIVLFGGHISGSDQDWINHNETWIYDFNTNTWTDMDPILAPPAMCAGAMEYDSESDIIVLHGGWPDGGVYETLSETWTYDLTTNTWTNVTTATQPSPRTWGAMTYDSDSDLMIYFGGLEYQPTWKTMSDTWTYDTNTNTWTEIDTEGPIIVGDLVYHPGEDKVVFYGGTADVSEAPEDLRSETWTYDTDTETWEEMILDVKPPDRSRGELIYDSESDRIILYEGVIWGGWPAEEVLHDCWAYDLTNNLWNNVDWDWQEMTPEISPSPRCDTPLVYDIESDAMVMFGGWMSTQGITEPYNDTWSFNYNTNTWTNMSPSSEPPGRGGHAMAYDEHNDVVIMFGGSVTGTSEEYWLADTWSYSLNTNTWTNMSPSSQPPARIEAGMAYDNESGVLVMFGGLNLDWSISHETWIFNFTDNTWTNVTTALFPDERIGGRLTYDYVRDEIVLSSGTNWEDAVLKDVWKYDYNSNTWTKSLPSSTPNCGGAIVYDKGSDIIVMYGGPTASEQESIAATWVFDPATEEWTNMHSPNNPPARSRPYLAYDIESNRTIMFGGAFPVTGDTWSYQYTINPPVPGPPRNLAVTQEDNGLELNWEAPLPIPGADVIAYSVYRGSESGEYELIANLGNVLTYTDKEAGYWITYYYAVTASSVNGEGPYSDEDTGYRDETPADNGEFAFIVYGDTRASGESAVAAVHDDLVSHFLQYDPEMVIHSGDMVYHGGEAYQWPLFDASISAIADWDPDIEFFGAAGNHEWYTDVYGVNDDDFSTYLGHFDFSSVVDETGETELNYAFDRNGIHFVVLNTVNDWSENVYTCPTAQMDWLETDLAKEHNFTIVITHYPSYSILADRQDRLDQAESLREAFQDVFTSDKVDIVFSGHNHYYYRTVRSDVYYITVAGGGAPIYETDTVDTDWIEGDVRSEEYHYCVCSLVEGNLVVKVVTLDGTEIDSMLFEDAVPIPIPTSPTSPTSNISGTGFVLDPLTLSIIIVGGAAVVIIVIVIIVKKKG